MDLILNDGFTEFPSAKNWLADYALLTESGINSIYDKTINKQVANKLLNHFNKLDEEGWLMFFLSPFTSFWLFEYTHKNSINGVEWLSLQIQAENFERIFVNKDITIFKKLPDKFHDDLRSFGIGSKKDNCLEAKFLNINCQLFNLSVNNIIGAFELIQKYTPGFYIDSLNFINSISLVDNNASFRGASGAKRRGLIYFSPDESWDEYKWAEEIIHETTHCLLDIISARKVLLNNPDAFIEKYQAPFRRDKRPLHGNFHALTVISRCVIFFQNVRDSNKSLELTMNNKIIDFLDKGKIPYEQLKKDAIFSNLGEVIFNSIINPVFMNK